MGAPIAGSAACPFFSSGPIVDATIVGAAKQRNRQDEKSAICEGRARIPRWSSHAS
jgi:hypothetical protein